MELVLEVGACEGDLQYALDVCAAAKEAGGHWVKGQIYHRDLLTSKTAGTYAQPGISVPATQYEDFEKQLTFDEWAQVKMYCDQIGIGFFFSVFDLL
jgi:sialic acid synthase SpsE